MLTMIMFAVVAAITLLCYLHRNGAKGTSFEAMLGSALFAILAGMFGGLVALTITFMAPQQNMVVIRPIGSLHTAPGTQGKFLTEISDGISSELYSFNELQNDVLIPQVVVGASTLRVVEDPALTSVGYMKETYKQQDRGSVLMFLSFSMSPVMSTQEIHVPVGSVDREYVN